MKKDYFDTMDEKMAEGAEYLYDLLWSRIPTLRRLQKKYPTRVLIPRHQNKPHLISPVDLLLWVKIPFVYSITPFLWMSRRNHKNVYKS